MMKFQKGIDNYGFGVLYILLVYGGPRLLLRAYPKNS
jgi:hypothetical protein